MRARPTVVLAAALMFLVLACAETPTEPVSAPLEGPALAKEDGCKGLDNARLKGGDPRSSVTCGPVSVSPADVIFSTATSSVTVTVTNNLPYPTVFYGTSTPGVEQYDHYARGAGTTCSSSGTPMASGESCVVVFERIDAEPFSFSGSMIFRAPHDGSYLSIPMTWLGK